MIVPSITADKLVIAMHESMCHSEFWRLEPALMERFFIYDLKKRCRNLKCAKCIIARPIDKSIKGRKITSVSSMPGDECLLDIMMLAQDQSSQNFKNVLVLVDTNTMY